MLGVVGVFVVDIGLSCGVRGAVVSSGGGTSGVVLGFGRSDGRRMVLRWDSISCFSL